MINRAAPPLEFIPPQLNPLVLRTLQLVLPSWLRWRTKITQIDAENVEQLVELYRQFQSKKIRFMLAFRHPRVEDPLCLGYLLSYLVPQMAKEQGIALKSPIHVHCIYDRGIPLWAGEHVGWLVSRLGGTPINRGKADWTGLRSARDLFANASLPMMAAPEGATNGHNEMVSPLEPGIAQLGFWCAEDLDKAGRDEEVLIVPVGIKYSYVDAPWDAIAQLLTELETASGLPLYDSSLNTSPLTASSLMYERSFRLWTHLLGVMEDFYKRFYYRTVTTTLESSTDKNAVLKARLDALLDTALQVSEEYFGLLPKGNFTDRCRRVEQAGWNYIFREELKDEQTLSPVEYGLANRIAEEAEMRMWHMRLVETFVAVTGKYVLEKPTPERFAETNLLIWDMVKRIQGANAFKRPRLGEQKVKITIGEPLSISQRYPSYKASRRGARDAVSDFTKDLQQALEGLVLK